VTSPYSLNISFQYESIAPKITFAQFYTTCKLTQKTLQANTPSTARYNPLAFKQNQQTQSSSSKIHSLQHDYITNSMVAKLHLFFIYLSKFLSSKADDADWPFHISDFTLEHFRMGIYA
jgi:hypothetical protein